jgi:hypothetical protein
MGLPVAYLEEVTPAAMMAGNPPLKKNLSS